MACVATITPFTTPECPDEKGRVVGLAFIHKNVHAAILADPSNPAVWVDGSYAADLTVFKAVRGTYDGGSAVTVAGVGNQDTKTINADRSLTVQVQGVKGNEAFWNDIRKSSNYYVAFVVGGDYGLLFINNKTVNVFAGAPVEEGLDTEVTWNVSITYKEADNPKSSNVPVGIFN
jgi:hypothetical protein